MIRLEKNDNFRYDVGINFMMLYAHKKEKRATLHKTRKYLYNITNIEKLDFLK